MRCAIFQQLVVKKESQRFLPERALGLGGKSDLELYTTSFKSCDSVDSLSRMPVDSKCKYPDRTLDWTGRKSVHGLQGSPPHFNVTAAVTIVQFGVSTLSHRRLRVTWFHLLTNVLKDVTKSVITYSYSICSSTCSWITCKMNNIWLIDRQWHLSPCEDDSLASVYRAVLTLLVGRNADYWLIYVLCIGPEQLIFSKSLWVPLHAPSSIRLLF